MRHIKLNSSKILLVGLSVSWGASLIGCATPSGSSVNGAASGPARQMSSKSEKSGEKTGEKGTANIEVRSLNGITAKDCPSSISGLPAAVAKDWKALVTKANSCLVGKNWFMVEQLGKSLSQLEPHKPWGAYYLSLAAEVHEDFPRAFWMIELALKKDPKLSAAKYQKARLYWRTEAFGEAVKLLQESVSEDPTLTDAHVMLGQIYMRDYELDKATKEFKLAVDRRPSEIFALDALADIEVYTGNGIGALSYLERATAIAPQRIDLMVKKAVVHETLLNQPEEALTIYRHIQTQSPRTRWEGTTPINVPQKIRDLEKAVQSKRSVANAAETKTGAKK